MAQTVVKELLAKFTGDTRGLDKASGRAQKALKAVRVAAMAASAAALATGGALFLLTKRSMEAADESAKFARSLGIPISELQAMRIVAEEAGSSQEKLGASLTLLQRTLSEASDGVATYKDAYDELGLNTQELMDLRPDEQFARVAEALNNVENSTRRTALTLDLFGRGGREIINMLSNYNANLDDARKFNEKFNLTLSELDSAKIEEANDRLSRLGMITQGIGNTLATYVSPLITAFADEVLGASNGSYTFGIIAAEAMKVAGLAIDIVRKQMRGLSLIFHGAVILIGEAVAQISLHLHDLGAEFAEISNKVFGTSLEAKKGLIDVAITAKMMANESKKAFKEGADEGVKFGDTLKDIQRIQAEAEERAKKAIAGGFGGSGRNSTNGIDPDKVDKVTDKVKKTNDTLKEQRDIVGDLGADMGDFFSQNMNGFEDVRSVALRALQDIASNVLRLSFGGESRGGLGGSIASLLVSGAGTFLNKTFGGEAATDAAAAATPENLASGGSFVVNGNAGLDRNILSMNGRPIANVSKGETIGVSRANGGGGLTVNQNINVTTGVQQTVRAEIMRMMPQIQSASTRAVDEARMRGKI